MHLFDSFAGLPAIDAEVDQLSPHVQSGAWKPGACRGVTKQQLHQMCVATLPAERIHIYDGWFKDTLVTLPADTRFALLHIDCDLYQSTMDVLEQSFGRGLVSAGAAVFFDDWNCNRASPTAASGGHGPSASSSSAFALLTVGSTAGAGTSSTCTGTTRWPRSSRTRR